MRKILLILFFIFTIGCSQPTEEVSEVNIDNIGLGNMKVEEDIESDYQQKSMVNIQEDNQHRNINYTNTQANAEFLEEIDQFLNRPSIKENDGDRDSSREESSQRKDKSKSLIVDNIKRANRSWLFKKKESKFDGLIASASKNYYFKKQHILDKNSNFEVFARCINGDFNIIITSTVIDDDGVSVDSAFLKHEKYPATPRGRVLYFADKEFFDLPFVIDQDYQNRISLSQLDLLSTRYFKDINKEDYIIEDVQNLNTAKVVEGLLPITIEVFNNLGSFEFTIDKSDEMMSVLEFCDYRGNLLKST